MADEIKFYAAVNAVKTLADGGIRVYLDLPEDAIVTAAELMACKRHGTVINIVATPRDNEPTTEDENRRKPTAHY